MTAPPHASASAERLQELALDELANARPASAVRALKQALTLNPELATAHFNLGMALSDLDRGDEAETAYRNALRIDPTCPAAHHKLGDLLLRRGQYEAARDSFARALALNPTLNESRLGLGDALVELGELETAVSCYREAIPTVAATGKLGHVLWKLGDSAGALAAFERALAADPGAAEAHYNLGSVQLDLGRLTAAAASAREALRLAPGFVEAAALCAAALVALEGVEAAEPLLGSLGGARARGYLKIAIRLMNSRCFDPARQCLQKVLLEDPGVVMARHLLSALSGDNPDHPVDGYVRELFDASAATFDRELVSKLAYDIPAQMVDALRAVECLPETRWNVLDLGCGTGLVGAHIAPYSRRLVGVDLAPNMIERAGARELYTELHCVDLMDALAQEQAREALYDVVTAADVFIYVGRLDEVIPAIRQVMRSGGLFALSAEAVEAAAGEGPDYRLGLMGRYAHGREYLQRLAAAHGFTIELLRATPIRLEHRRPVTGWLTVWRAA